MGSSIERPAGFWMDRGLQRRLLIAMRDVYPGRLYETEEPFDAVLGQLAYLDEHGLCEANLLASLGGGYAWNGSSITAKGLDFLEEDGGLTAILGVVTVKLHADTIRDLLEAKVDGSNLPPERKSALKEHLRKLPAAALQAATVDLVKSGLDHLPDAIHWLQTLPGLG